LTKILALSLLFIFSSCSKDTEFKEISGAGGNEENIGSISEPPGGDESDTSNVGKKTIVIANRADENVGKPKKDSAGYEELGVWEQSRILGFKNRISRYSSDPLASVTYTSDKVKQSRYCLSVYRMTHANSIDKALYQIIDDENPLAEKTIDHRADETEKGWYNLGEHSFSSGVAKVVLTRSDDAGAGVLRADDIRFRRLEEGFDCQGKVVRVVKKHAVLDNRKDENNTSSKRDTNGYRQQGSWSQSVISGYKGKISRYSFERDASAHYYAQVTEPEYCVRFYRVTHPNSSKLVSITIKVNGVARDEKQYDYALAVDQKGWVAFGNYSFSKDDQVEVIIKKAGAADDDVLRADALQLTTKLSRCE
jgi:hypothetical protein